MAADHGGPGQRCDWSDVCPRWPGHRLVRVRYRGAEPERIAVCEAHLPYALAKGFELRRDDPPGP